MYRLMGETDMPLNTRLKRWRTTEYAKIPHDALPIPYTLTDFGRAYLAFERARAMLEVQAYATHSDIGSPLPRLATRVTRSPRTR